MNNLDFAKEVIRLVGGYPNIIVVFNCYTRIRVNIRDLKKVDSEGLKKLEGVMGVVIDGAQVQIIVGPGKSSKLTQVVNQTLEASLFLQQEQEAKKSTAIAEFEKAEEEKKRIEREAYLKGKLESTKVNTFTNKPIKDEYDLKVFKLQQEIESSQHVENVLLHCESGFVGPLLKPIYTYIKNRIQKDQIVYGTYHYKGQRLCKF